MSRRARQGGEPDFAVIDGINRKTARALRRAGIASMSELAAMSVADVAQALDEVGRPVRPQKIIAKNWLQQAWRLADDTDEVAVSRPAAADDEPVWDEFAGYFIYFDRARSAAGTRWRTRVWDTRNLVEEEFPGSAPGPWITFVLGGVELPPAAGAQGQASFEVDEAAVEHRDTPDGRQTWLRAEIAIDVRQHGALEAAVGSALLRAVLPELGRGVEGGEGRTEDRAP